MALDRFLNAQADSNSGYATALSEIKRGQKVSHWIWYVFPQLAALGRSSTAKFYGLRDRDEAIFYLHEPTLRQCLLEITAAVYDQLKRGVPLDHLMGGTTDSLKLVSCLTLFRGVAPAVSAIDLTAFCRQCEAILAVAAAQGFPLCAVTDAELSSAVTGDLLRTERN